MRAVRHLLLLFVFTLLAYAAAFAWIEHRRAQNGPWQITFTAAAGTPALVINQPKLGIQNLRLTFPGVPPPTNAPQTIAFDSARTVPFAVPFGRCVFLDTLSLPGTVALQIHGHEIQLLPRVLTIDKREQLWSSNRVIPLPAPVK